MGQSLNNENHSVKFQNIVAIYGTKLNDFRWAPDGASSPPKVGSSGPTRIEDSTKQNLIYHTTGLLIRHNHKTYVVTTRSKIISCQNIVMFCNCCADEQQVMNCRLHVLFQMIEYDLVIMEPILTERVSNENFPLGLTINEYTVLSEILKSKCVAIRINIRAEIGEPDKIQDLVDYQIHIHPISYLTTANDYATYLPPILKYQFTFDDEHDPHIANTKLNGIIGSVVFDDNSNLIGIIHKIHSETIFVIPSHYLQRAVSNFTMFLTKPNEFFGPLTLPLDLKVVGNDVLINSSLKINTSDGTKLLKKNDKLLKLNDNLISPQLTVWSEHLETELPLDIYLRTELKYQTMGKLLIDRNGKQIIMNFVGVPAQKFIFPLTAQPYFGPESGVLHINIRGLIVTLFTHELIDILISYGKSPSNQVIDSFFVNGISTHKHYLLVIDCINDNLTESYQLPVLKSKSKGLGIPIVKKVNSRKVKTLADIEMIRQSDQEYRSIELEDCVGGKTKIVF